MSRHTRRPAARRSKFCELPLRESTAAHPSRSIRSLSVVTVNKTASYRRPQLKGRGLSNNAERTVSAAGLVGETGRTVHVGMATRRAQSLDDALGDVIPGFSSFLGGTRRIVLVTDRSIHLFRGRRFDRPEGLLGSYPLGGEEIAFDGAKLSFPDGQVVFMTAHQAGELMRDAVVENRESLAAELARRLGITDEVGITVATGKSLTKTDRLGTVIERVADLVIDGELSIDRVGEGRVVLVTDRFVRLYCGDRAADIGALIGAFPVGQSTLSCETNCVTFPDGEVVRFQDDCARRLCDCAGQG